MSVPKTDALPLGYTPYGWPCLGEEEGRRERGLSLSLFFRSGVPQKERWILEVDSHMAISEAVGHVVSCPSTIYDIQYDIHPFYHEVEQWQLLISEHNSLSFIITTLLLLHRASAFSSIADFDISIRESRSTPH
jgi:hypothetical protein